MSGKTHVNSVEVTLVASASLARPPGVAKNLHRELRSKFTPLIVITAPPDIATASCDVADTTGLAEMSKLPLEWNELL